GAPGGLRPGAAERHEGLGGGGGLQGGAQIRSRGGAVALAGRDRCLLRHRASPPAGRCHLRPGVPVVTWLAAAAALLFAAPKSELAARAKPGLEAIAEKRIASLQSE